MVHSGLLLRNFIEDKWPHKATQLTKVGRLPFSAASCADWILMDIKELLPERQPFVNEIRDKVLRRAIIESNIMDVIRENGMPYEELMSKYRCAIMEIETKFNVLNEQFSLQYDRNPIETIKTRLKSVDSIARKLARKGVAFTVASLEENLDDIAGVRVVCSFQEDIYTLADCLLEQDDIELVEIKDYIKHPKESGYRSLHLIVKVPIFLQDEKCRMKVEVQLRTIAMDFWASLEHKLRYKKEIDPKDKNYLQKELLDCAQVIAGLDDRMEKIKNRLDGEHSADKSLH